MYKNGWDKIRLVCLNHEDDYSKTFKLTEANNYVCENFETAYQGKSSNNCENSLQIADYEWILQKVDEIANEGIAEADITGCGFRHRDIYYEVLKQDDKFTIGVYNERKLGRRYC